MPSGAEWPPSPYTEDRLPGGGITQETGTGMSIAILTCRKRKEINNAVVGGVCREGLWVASLSQLECRVLVVPDHLGVWQVRLGEQGGAMDRMVGEVMLVVRPCTGSWLVLTQPFSPLMWPSLTTKPGGLLLHNIWSCMAG